MIDIENAYKEFEEYVKQFNPEDGRIKLKIDHIKRVAIKSRQIAEYLKLDEEHIKLAEIIGIFHDIGRFKQIEIYNTFSDKDSANHAELGVKVLFEDNLIERFKIEECYKYIIKKAILNHNKARIESGLTEEEELYAKIIRDADKLDIYHVICEDNFKDIFWYSSFECEKISDIVFEQFVKNHVINYADVNNNADQIMTFYAYIYDLYFAFSREYLKSKGYLDKFADRIYEHFTSEEVKQQVKKVLRISNDYLSDN